MISNKNTYVKLVYCLIAFLILSGITLLIKNYFTPFFIIIFMLFLCKPMYELLYKSKIFNNNISAAITLLFVNLLIFFMFFYIGKIFVGKVFDILKYNYLISISQIDKYLGNLSNLFNIHISNFSESMGNFSSKISYNTCIKQGAIHTTNWICDCFISNICVYFILIDKYVIFKTLEMIVPKNKILSFRKRLNELYKVFKIEMFLIIITTLETMFGLLALNVNSAVFLALLCGILDLIPYIGTIIVFIPLILYYFINESKIIAFGLIMLYVLIQITRQIWEAKFVSNNLKIHPLAIIIGIYLGVKIFGFIGLFIAPIYIVTIKEIIFSN